MKAFLQKLFALLFVTSMLVACGQKEEAPAEEAAPAAEEMAPAEAPAAEAAPAAEEPAQTEPGGWDPSKGE